MLGAILTGIVAMILMGIAEQTFSEKNLIETDDSGKRNVVIKNVDDNGWLRAIAFGVIVGIILYVTPKLAGFWLFIAPIFFIVMIGLYVYLAYRWREKGKKFVGILCFALLAGLIYFTAMSTAHMTAACFKLQGGWSNLVTTIPLLLLIAAFFFFILDRIFFYSYEKRMEATNDEGKVVDEEADARARISRIAGIILAILVTLLLIAALIGGIKGANFNLPSPFDRLAERTAETADTDDTRQQEDVQEALDNLTVHKLTAEELEQLTLEKYRNISHELLTSSLSTKDRERTESTGFSDALTFGFTSTKDEDRFLELEEEILRNPIYGVTVVNAIRDKKIGSTRIGDLNPWMDEMAQLNEKSGVAYWLERDSESGTIYVTEEYRIYAATLCTWLERLVSQGEQTRTTVENWCLNGAARNNDRAGVLADYQYKKEALVLSYVGKNGNNIFTIGFNIHDKRPEFYPDKEPEQPTTPTNPPDDPTNPPDDPTDPPDDPTDPPYNKDPSKAPKENTEPNDDPGPGPNTNTGAGSQHSSEDQDTNSDHYQSYDDYRNDINDLEDTNDNQRQGGDSNTPSTQPPSSDTNVDNNGDRGTGNGSIDDPTPTQPPAQGADGTDISDDQPGGAWGGPPD